MATTPIMILLFIGYIIFTIDKKKENFPVPLILIVVGIGLSFIPYFSSIEVTKDMIYHVFLPGLLFTSAYRFSPNALKRNAGIISFLATIGIMLTVLFLGWTIYVVSGLFVSLSLVGSMLIAAMLTPTDPVSIVSILKKSSGDEMMADVVEGESLINDGTSIVIFTVILSIFLHDKTFSIRSFLGEFLFVSIGGMLIGLVFGWLFSKAIHITHHKEYQVMLSIVLAYGIFNTAEHFGVSGVLATVFAGIMLSFEFNRSLQEDHFRESLDGFWSVVEISILSLLFLLIGVESTSYLAFDYWVLASLIFVASLLVRFLIIAGATQTFPVWRHTINWRESLLLSWSGLKGSMSVFLILNLQAQEAQGTELILSLTFAAVLLSLVVQSIGIHPLSKKLLNRG
ncbi:sodium:proton antiporter [Halobacillus shinanisalinarum]|uniref:Sodium:proton antiporter n=1 Tax=Halobacillus shinanisalinarum TaxID=2932258 RepID=A0ABY4GWV3_9BACI|nr:sodium:proton antiporter [Halobacillus shinanisalinarum]UOQ92195.1 sodium:proton antiporter [Halobacillus shinanisalinarum]